MWLLAVALIAISQVALAWLDGWYARSQFPVPFFVGQTTFNATELKGYYAVLIEQGTLGTFVTTQMVDLVYMATIFAAFFSLMIAIYVIMPAIRAVQTVAAVMVFVAPLAGVFDLRENILSFITLANPLSFADWLVYPYSSFAVVKFGVYSLTYLWAPLGITIGLGNLAYRSLTRKSALNPSL